MNLYNNTLRSPSNWIAPDMVINAEIDYYNPESMRPSDGAAPINKKTRSQIKNHGAASKKRDVHLGC